MCRRVSSRGSGVRVAGRRPPAIPFLMLGYLVKSQIGYIQIQIQLILEEGPPWREHSFLLFASSFIYLDAFFEHFWNCWHPCWTLWAPILSLLGSFLSLWGPWRGLWEPPGHHLATHGGHKGPMSVFGPCPWGHLGSPGDLKGTRYVAET